MKTIKAGGGVLFHLKIYLLFITILFPHSYSIADEGSDDDDYGRAMGSSPALACTTDDLVISQGPMAPLPNGIPTYTVQIVNACISGCTIASIHVRCGWFSSARLVDPTIFRRLSYDDCLVNNGDSLASGQSLTFQYANSFHYPLSVSSLDCY